MELKAQLIGKGACLVKYGDLQELPASQRQNLPLGISIAVAYPRDVIVPGLPTKQYYKYYRLLNKKLDALGLWAKRYLQQQGYQAIAQTKGFVKSIGGSTYQSLLPHKTVATRSGLGWIGKCALLITPEYGSAVRLTSVLTDAPLLPVEAPINESKCGNCENCKKICPANAITGKNWEVGSKREELYDAFACRETTVRNAKEKIGEAVTICGKCIQACPFTQGYLKN